MLIIIGGGLFGIGIYYFFFFEFCGGLLILIEGIGDLYRMVVVFGIK